MKIFYTLPLMAMAALSANAQTVQAPPHSLTGKVNYTTVELSWKGPEADNVLKWHNDYSYNGMVGKQTNPSGPAVLYAANRFSPSDLFGRIGSKVTHIEYEEYRNVADVTVMIYEDGKPVYSQPVAVTDWEKHGVRKVKLDTPYVIPDGKEIMFVVKKVHGTNQDFATTCDKTVTPGKGNVYSYDGETWYDNGPGDFLITTYLETPGGEAPRAYNVYADGVKVNENYITGTSYKITGQAEGDHVYQVASVYYSNGETTEVKSYELPLTTVDIDNLVPPVVSLSGKVKDLDGTLSWSAPLLNADELTWSGPDFGMSIGGTASSNTKVWIRQDFETDELYFGSFIGNNITAINSFICDLEKDNIKEPVTGMTLFIMKDGVIVYSEEVPSSAISSINYNAWNKFALSQPFLIEDGHKYSFGIYYLQKYGAHPIGIDNRPAVDVKANSFSTSSPKDDFNASDPTWRTLASGDIPGNFMLSADVVATGTPAQVPVITGYDIYRDGVKIGNTETTSYSDTVEELGKYNYSVVTVAQDGRTSLPVSVSLNYTLPSGYVAPTIVSSSFDKNTKKFDLSWSPYAYEMRHYGTPTYIYGFEEEMDGLMWGAQFSAEDMADYAGYKINNITFGIGDDTIGDFELVIMADKEELYALDIAKGTVDAGYMYTFKLDDADIIIPEGKNIYLAYRADCPAESTPILLDDGPAKTGGAMLTFTNGKSWSKLSTLNPAAAQYNIVIGAIISPAGEMTDEPSADKMAVIGNVAATRAAQILLSASELRKLEAEDGIEAAGRKNERPAKAAPKAVSFKIYRNGEMIKETADMQFSEVLDSYGYFDYNVKSIFANGWESNASQTVSILNRIPQKAQAPYNLQATEENGTLKLAWEAIDADAAVRKYHDENSKNMAYGMTGSSMREGFHAIKFKNGEIAPGTRITHVKFMLNEVMNEAEQRLQTASVIIMLNEAIMYEQSVNVSDLATATWHVVRLNQPFVVPERGEVGVGYHLTYPNGLKPIMIDAGPAVKYYGDLISGSAAEGYWYSCAEKYGMNGNLRIEAVTQVPDQEIKLKARGAKASVTFNVQLDGLEIAKGLTEMKYDVENAAQGFYTVTATVDGEESAESNGIQYGEKQSGVENIVDAASGAYYDSAAKCLVLPVAANADIYTVSGVLVERHLATNRVDLSSLPKGAYIVTTDSGVVMKVMR